MRKVVWTTFVKEALDLLRDRRALFFLFAPPLLIPLLGAVGGAFVVWQVLRQTRGGLPVAVVNGEQLPGLTARLDGRRELQLVDPPPDPSTALQSGGVVAVLEIPLDSTERLQAEQPLTLTLTSSRGGWLPDLAVASIQDVLDGYADEELAQRLARRGLDQRWLSPIRLARAASARPGVVSAPTVASGVASSSLGSVFLPLAVASWAFGGLSMVAYMTVGEKERHTMESLLITPASRVGIILGKIALSIVVSAVTIGLWSLDSLVYVFVVSALPSGFERLPTSVAAQWGSMGLALTWLVVLMLPLMTMASGLVAAVCIFAKNYRESNLFLGLLQLLLPGLALVATFAIGARPPLAVYALPVVGVLVAIRDLFGGGVVPGALVLTWLAAAAYAAAAIFIAAYVFSREWALMRGV